MTFLNGMTSTTPRMWIIRPHQSSNTQQRSYCQPQPRSMTMTSATSRAQWQDLPVSLTLLPMRSCHQVMQTATWGNTPSISSTPSTSPLLMTSPRSAQCEKRSIMTPSTSSMATKGTTHFSHSKNLLPSRQQQSRSRRSTRSRSPRRTNLTMQEQATNPRLSNKTNPNTRTRVTSQMAATSLTVASLLVNRNPSNSRRNNQSREMTMRSQTSGHPASPILKGLGGDDGFHVAQWNC